MLSFRLANKKILLTYPQWDVAPVFFQEQFTQFCEVNNLDLEYDICCKEDHHETEGTHIHCYCQFRKAVKTRNERFFDLCGHHPNIEIVKSTPHKVVQYVMKDGNYTEYNQEMRPICPFDKLSKSEKNRYLLDHDIPQLIEEGSISLLSLDRLTRNIRIYKELTRKFNLREVTVKWYFGETGTGKTYTARNELLEQYGEYWVWNGNFQWFDGYNGQLGVLIDDFRRKDVDFNWMLQLLDKYPLRVPVKGGFTEWKPETIIITCPVDSREAWQWIDKDGEIQDWDSYDQLERRIKEHREFNEKYIPTSE